MGDQVSEHASALAAELLKAAQDEQSPLERAEAAQMVRLMWDPPGRSFAIQMVDCVFRSRKPRRQAKRFRALLRQFGPPAFLSPNQRRAMRMGAAASCVVPGLVMRVVAAHLRRDTSMVILPAEPERFHRYLGLRQASQTGVIVNPLGEAVLGEQEAARRLESVLALLNDPQVQAVSVKISSIFSQINLLDWDGTLRILCERLRRLYRAALAGHKFVNLDMEEYRDLRLTVASFQAALSAPEFKSLRAGLVLQAYLPESWTVLRELTDWALARVTGGGAPIKLRLVKGANLAMETVEAEWHGWARAPYLCKEETDANFCRMLDFACDPRRARAVNVSVGSHNLFDIALGLVLRQKRELGSLVEFEMLEGMAPAQARVVRQAAGGLVLYAPVVRRENFNNALAYLLRRLDENTTPNNFLRDLFDLSPESESWRRQRDRFEAGWDLRFAVAAEPRRSRPVPHLSTVFGNTPDTDWTQQLQRVAVLNAIAHWRPEQSSDSDAVNAGSAVESLAAAQPAWEASGFEHRAALLRRCAEVMEQGRRQTIACMVHDAKKAVVEADAEVSEAIDFARYYAKFQPGAGAHFSAVRVVLVAPPWNFPYAIPCGGVLAALMAGNAVALKPAPQTVATARRLINQLWEAGIPREVLCFHPCDESASGRLLLTDPGIGAVILTGACQTARLFLDWRPSLRLMAETSGKNSIIITSQADHDLAVKDLVKSAFSHAGQKCSAASLAILESEVYDNPLFRRQLEDAASSLPVGPATNPASVVTPLIRPPVPDLLRALTTLDEGEEWLLSPRQVGGDHCLWSPGIKLGVKRGSWFHRTECFGPVLGLMRAKDLDEAIEMQNDSEFGLTAGLQSLDEEEIARWRGRVAAGNAYVNRAITGAIVQRQPFGGWKHSSFGPGAKAGGPNYVAMFARLQDAADAEENYERVWHDYFSREHDPSGLRCESNVLRYVPCRGVVLRLDESDTRSLALARKAAEVCGVPLHVSLSGSESEETLAARLRSFAPQAEFLRTVRPPSDALLRSAYAAGLNWIDAPLLSEGRFELTRWLREQAISQTRHRHGLIVNQ